jgi:hypothetical protein
MDGMGPARQVVSCTEQRAAAEQACGQAAEARAVAQQAAAAPRELRRHLSDAEARIEQGRHDADRRMLSDAKADAQRRYRATMAAAATPAAVAEATTVWMHEVDRLNRGARHAAATMGRARREAAEWQRRLDEAIQVADGRRIAAESAAARCLDARRALAECEEAAAAAEREAATYAAHGTEANDAAAGPAGPPGRPRRAPGEDHRRPAPATGATAARATAAGATAAGAAATGPAAAGMGHADRSGDGVPAIFRLLRGDRGTLTRIAEDLAVTQGREASTYQLLLVELAEGIVDAAREEGAVHLPEGHPFWDQFEPEEAQALSTTLARMGYRSDGQGGWLAGRSPNPNEMAIAVAHIGYDIRTLRRIPSANELPMLLRGAWIAAEDHLARIAPDMMLDEMVELLGARAERLAVLWDDWGRVRPLLLDRTG